MLKGNLISVSFVSILLQMIIASLLKSQIKNESKMTQFKLLFIFLLVSTAISAQETWNVDNPHSNLRFEVGWQDFSVRTGEFKVFEGTMVTNSREDLSDANISFKVDAASVDVIAERLAGHIKSDKFLDVENYPDITYTSSQAVKNDDGTYTSKGMLTIHGVEKEQEVAIKVKGSKETKKGFIYGLEVSLTVNRMDYGLDWGAPRLAENITLVGHLLYKLKVETEND